jgi:hypothetical protein
MLGEKVDKVFVFMLHQNLAFISRVFCHVLDAISSEPCKTMLGNWWSPYISSVVL